MLVRSSPVEWTPVTLPPWYQSQTIATAFPARNSQTAHAAAVMRAASGAGRAAVSGGAGLGPAPVSGASVVSTATSVARNDEGTVRKV